MSERVDTAAMLDDVRDFIKRYVVLPGDAYYDVVALWAAHTHVIGAFDNTPRLLFRSPEKESGKTRSLEVLEVLVSLPRLVVNITVAAIYRRLKDTQITLLFDEVDAVFNPKMVRDNEELRALLNAGYRRGATVERCVGEGKKQRVEEFPVFAATALASIGDLPDTIESRAILVPMRRRAPDESVESFRRRKVTAEAQEIRDQLDQWAVHAVDLLADAEPAMPDEVTDRAADIWEPLIAIADLAGEEWGRRARAAAVLVVKGRVAEDQSTGVRLLADIRTVGVTSVTNVTQTRIGVTEVTEVTHGWRLASAELCRLLNASEESPWGGWNGGQGISQRDLAKRLKPYGIDPRVIKLPTGGTARGYHGEDFGDAWSRYLRAEQPNPNGRCRHDLTSTANGVMTCLKCGKAVAP